MVSQKSILSNTTMSELHLGSGPSFLRYDLYRQITLRTNGVPYKVKKLQIVF
jgi:hypothetical protein